jgi:hypothetical protein
VVFLLAKHSKRSLAKQQQTDVKADTVTQGAVLPERKKDE